MGIIFRKYITDGVLIVFFYRIQGFTVGITIWRNMNTYRGIIIETG